MEFLVRMEVHLPDVMSDERRRELLEEEARRGRELIEGGLLVRIWRVPGRWANISLYRADDATDLHSIVTSLPLWPWIDAHVEPLAVHPLELRE